MAQQKILIAGAGIGGLTAASCLMSQGFEVEIYEQAPVLSEVGAGIQISANAMHVIRYLGLGVWSRSVGESAKLIPHSGRDYGPGTSRLRHDHARRPNCDTAIEGSAQGTSGAAWAEPQDSCQVA